MRTFQYTYQGETHTVKLTPASDGSYHAEIAGIVYRVSHVQNEDDALDFRMDGIMIRAYVEHAESIHHIAWDGSSPYNLSDMETGSSRRRGGGGTGGSLTAQMPGQVIAIEVNEGDHVEQGDTLLILEAMKMEMRVTAPYAGRVAAIKVSVGDTVNRGQQLIEVLPDEE